MRLDLHIHTTASDGAWAPERVVGEAARARLDAIAVADHDTVAGVPVALAAARVHGIEVVPATEMSSTWEGREIHVLGYFVDLQSPEIARHRARAARLREERMREMIARLSHEGIEVDLADVVAQAGGSTTNLGRPHLARALVARGYASSPAAAFRSAIGDGQPAFVPTGLQRPREAVRAILDAGGVPVWAHPPADLIDATLPELLDAGLRGLEVYRPGRRGTDAGRLLALCRRHGLVASGGSDWHGPEGGRSLGDFHVSGARVAALLDEGGWKGGTPR